MQNYKDFKAECSKSAERSIYELVHGKIVPDLLLSYSKKCENNPLTMAQEQKYDFHPSDIASLAKYLIDGKMEKAEELIASHASSGCPSSKMILSLLVPAAQLMGDKWCADAASFAEVTLGMMELHSLLRIVEKGLSEEFTQLKNPGKILLSVVPGDTHIFGITVLQSFFFANGWEVDVLLDPTEKQISAQVHRTNYDIVGISVSTTNDIESCKKLFKLIKENTSNMNIACMAGGLPFILDKNLQSHVGAEYVASNAVEALAIAASICEKKQSIESSLHHA